MQIDQPPAGGGGGENKFMPAAYPAGQPPLGWSFEGRPPIVNFPQIMPMMSPSTENWATVGNTPPLPPPCATSAIAAAAAGAAGPNDNSNRRSSKRVAEKSIAHEIIESADV